MIRVSVCESEFSVCEGQYDEFWTIVADGFWEPRSFRIVQQWVDSTTTVIDVGAWIGPIALYAATRARQVYAFEPDPAAYAELRRNRDLNPNLPLACIEAAIDLQAGKSYVGISGQPGDSRSSMLFLHRSGWEVETVALETFIKGVDRQGRVFIKVDVEGHEYKLIPALVTCVRELNAMVYLSTHANVIARHGPRAVPGNGILARTRRLVRRWLTGRLWAVYLSAYLAARVGRSVRVLDPKGVTINLWMRLPRVLIGLDFTRDRSILLTAK